jgi:hypothetical protein
MDKIGVFLGGKSAGEWDKTLTSILCGAWAWLEPYLHCPPPHNGFVTWRGTTSALCHVQTRLKIRAKTIVRANDKN